MTDILERMQADRQASQQNFRYERAQLLRALGFDHRIVLRYRLDLDLPSDVWNTLLRQALNARRTRIK